MGKRSKSKFAEAALDKSTIEDDDGEHQYVSMATVKELLKVQESTLRTLFETVVNSLTTRVDEVVQNLAAIRASLEYSQREIDQLKPLEGQLNTFSVTVDKLSRDLVLQDLKAEYLENQSRRNNIRVSGIPESDDKETWEETESKVQKVVEEKLGIKLEIERAHRVERRKRQERSGNADKPRTIVCRFKSWKQKEQVLMKARKNKPVGLFISEDLALATLKKRELLIPQLKAAKEAGKIAYFVLDKLVIRDKPN